MPDQTDFVCRVVLLLLLGASVRAESNSSLTGRVVDPSDKPIPGTQVVLRNAATLLEYSATVNQEGIYEIVALPVHLPATGEGPRLQVVHDRSSDHRKSPRTFLQDVHLEVGDLSQEVTVKSDATLIDAVTTSVGHVIDGRMVPIPLNGRYFLDLALLAPGSVTPTSSYSRLRPAAD